MTPKTLTMGAPDQAIRSLVRAPVIRVAHTTGTQSLSCNKPVTPGVSAVRSQDTHDRSGSVVLIYAADGNQIVQSSPSAQGPVFPRNLTAGFETTRMLAIVLVGIRRTVGPLRIGIGPIAEKNYERRDMPPGYGSISLAK